MSSFILLLLALLFPLPEAFAEKWNPDKTKEEKLRKEFEDYHSAKEKRDNTTFIKEHLFYDHADQHVGIDFIFNDLNQFNHSTQPDTKVNFSTNSLNLSYALFLLQSRFIGRLGLGLHSGFIFVKDTSSKESSIKHRFTTVGPFLTYEAKFLIGQFFVPFVNIGYDVVFNGTEIGNKNFNTLVWSVGFLLNLNRLDTKTASNALANTGIRKFNLSVALSSRQGKQDTESSQSLGLGLRFEY